MTKNMKKIQRNFLFVWNDKFKYVEQSMIVTGRYFDSVLFLYDGNSRMYMV